MIILRSIPGPFTLSDEEKRRQTFETVVEWLPNVRRAELTLSHTGRMVPDYQVKEVVSRGTRTASPLKHIAGLVLLGSKHETAQRLRIHREVREALGCQ